MAKKKQANLPYIIYLRSLQKKYKSFIRNKLGKGKHNKKQMYKN